MIVKIVALFLVAMLVLGMVGKLRAPRLRGSARKPGKCSQCGAFLVGRGPCPCGKAQ